MNRRLAFRWVDVPVGHARPELLDLVLACGTNPSGGGLAAMLERITATPVPTDDLEIALTA